MQRAFQEADIRLRDDARQVQESYISRLPPELLTAMFMHLVEGSLSPGPNPRYSRSSSGQPRDRVRWTSYFSGLQPTNITQVCRSWRALSLDIPTLWYNWHVNLKYPQSVVFDILDAFIARSMHWSRDASLDFCIRLKSLTYSWHGMEGDDVFKLRAQQALDQICQVQHRWRTTEINSQGHGTLVLRPAELQNVEVLRLQVRYRIDDSRTSFPSLLNLRELNICHAYFCNLDILEYVQGSKSLEQLSIACPSQFSHGRDRMQLVLSQAVSRIRRLDLQDLHEDSGDADIDTNTLLAIVDFPALENIALRNILPVEILAMANSLPRYHPPLVSVTFHLHAALHDNGRSIVTFLSNSPHLTHLAVQSLHPNGTYMSSLVAKLAAKVDCTFILVSRLETLDMYGILAPLTLFTKLLISRWDALASSRTLQSVILRGCGGVVNGQRIRGLQSLLQTSGEDNALIREFQKKVKHFLDDGFALEVDDYA